MSFSKLIFAILIALLLSGCSKNNQTPESKLTGSWKLEKIESLDNSTGKWYTDSTFNGWTGYIIYDGKSNMGVQITPKGYKDASTNKNLDSLSPGELKALVKLYRSNWVYFAEYKITNSTVEHRRLSATEPKEWGTTLLRDFEFKSDTLVLLPHETLANKKSRLCWVRM